MKSGRGLLSYSGTTCNEPIRGHQVRLLIFIDSVHQYQYGDEVGVIFRRRDIESDGRRCPKAQVRVLWGEQ